MTRRLAFLLLVASLALGAFLFWKSERRARRIASVTAIPPALPPRATSPQRAAPAPSSADSHPLRPPFTGEIGPPRLLPRPAEPSGGTYLEELGGFLVADDESTLGEQRGIYFLERSADGQLRELTVRLGESALAFQWDDLEAVAASPENVFFLASHAYDSSWRQRLCHAPRKELKREKDSLEIGVLWCMPERSSRAGIQAALATAAPAADFDLEGLAWSPGERLYYVGVRAPLAGGKAILLAMDPRGVGRAAYPSFALGHTLDLGGRGVRGLTFLDDTRLLIAAGPAGDEPGRFDLFLFDLSAPKKERAPLLLTPEGFPARSSEGRELRIEGLAFDGQGVLVLCDSGEWPEEEPPGAPAYFFYLELAGPEAKKPR